MVKSMRYKTLDGYPLRVSPKPDGRGYFRITWQTEDGWCDARRKTYGDALALAATLGGNAVDLSAMGPHATASVNDLIDWYLHPRARSREWAPTTLRNQTSLAEKWSRPLLGNLTPEEWTPQRSRDVIHLARSDGYAASTIETIGVHLRAIVNVARRDGLIDHDPMAGVAYTKSTHRGGKATNYVDPEDIPDRPDVERLANAMEHLSPRLGRLAVYLSGYSALRAGEVWGLKVGDVDLGGGSLRVQRQARWHTGGVELDLPKRGKKRTTIFPEFMDHLLGAAVSGRPPDEPLFPDEDGGHRRHDSVMQAHFKEARALAGWPRLTTSRGTTKYRWTWHSLRHHAATWMLANQPDGLGLEVADVSSFLGHASPAITWQVYVSVRPGAVARARAASSRLA